MRLPTTGHGDALHAPITADYGAAPEIAEIPGPNFGPDEVVVVVVKVTAGSVAGFDMVTAGQP